MIGFLATRIYVRDLESLRNGKAVMQEPPELPIYRRDHGNIRDIGYPVTLPDDIPDMGGGTVNIRVRAYHTEIEVYLNGELVIRCADTVQPWTTGYIGFYGTGSEMICSGLQFQEI